MLYLITFIVLMLLEWAYLPVARRLEIGNKVTYRSSHKYFVITGGGFIFLVALLIYYIAYSPGPMTLMTRVVIGATALGIISFADDVHDVPPLWRLLVQTIVVAYTFSDLCTGPNLHVFIVIVVCGVGLINAYNFMDGINGMLAGYTLVVLGSLYWAYSTVPYWGSNAPMQLIIMLAIAVAVFAFFNMRSNALCFCGDVGAIVMGFLITYLIIWLVLNNNQPQVMVFVMVYVVDAGLTVVQRLFLGENILTPHRRHVYQVLVNQWGLPHWRIALVYAGVQAVINAVYFAIDRPYRWLYVLLVAITLIAIYFLIKRSPRSRAL